MENENAQGSDAGDGVAMAAEVEVKMLNKGAEGLMVFEPALVKIEPGDTVKFVATDKGHNAESIKGMFPADATPFVGKNGEDVSVTFDKPGAYGVRWARRSRFSPGCSRSFRPRRLRRNRWQT